MGVFFVINLNKDSGGFFTIQKNNKKNVFLRNPVKKIETSVVYLSNRNFKLFIMKNAIIAGVAVAIGVLGATCKLQKGYNRFKDTYIQNIKVLPVDEMETPTDQYLWIESSNGRVVKYKYDAVKQKLEVIN